MTKRGVRRRAASPPKAVGVAVQLSSTAQQLSFALPGATATALALPEGLGFAQWERVGRVIRLVATAARWWTGDALRFGEATYGEQYAQAIEATGRNYEDVQRMIRVAERVPPERRLADLSWSHHAEVASLEGGDQTKWLKRAVAKGWTVRELRAALAGPGGADGDTKQVSFTAAKGPCACCQGGCSTVECRCGGVASPQGSSV